MDEAPAFSSATQSHLDF